MLLLPLFCNRPAWEHGPPVFSLSLCHTYTLTHRVHQYSKHAPIVAPLLKFSQQLKHPADRVFDDGPLNALYTFPFFLFLWFSLIRNKSNEKLY